MTDDFVAATCKPGKTDCCRYLTMAATGWMCAKLNPGMRALLDARVAAGTMRATGDNCLGVAD